MTKSQNRIAYKGFTIHTQPGSRGRAPTAVVVMPDGISTAAGVWTARRLANAIQGAKRQIDSIVANEERLGSDLSLTSHSLDLTDDTLNITYDDANVTEQDVDISLTQLGAKAKPKNLTPKQAKPYLQGFSGVRNGKVRFYLIAPNINEAKRFAAAANKVRKHKLAGRWHAKLKGYVPAPPVLPFGIPNPSPIPFLPMAAWIVWAPAAKAAQPADAVYNERAEWRDAPVMEAPPVDSDGEESMEVMEEEADETGGYTYKWRKAPRGIQGWHSRRKLDPQWYSYLEVARHKMIGTPIGKFDAIYADGKGWPRHLGYYDTPEQAQRVLDAQVAKDNLGDDLGAAKKKGKKKVRAFVAEIDGQRIGIFRTKAAAQAAVASVGKIMTAKGCGAGAGVVDEGEMVEEAEEMGRVPADLNGFRAKRMPLDGQIRVLYFAPERSLGRFAIFRNGSTWSLYDTQRPGARPGHWLDKVVVVGVPSVKEAFAVWQNWTRSSRQG